MNRRGTETLTSHFFLRYFSVSLLTTLRLALSPRASLAALPKPLDHGSHGSTRINPALIRVDPCDPWSKFLHSFGCACAALGLLRPILFRLAAQSKSAAPMGAPKNFLRAPSFRFLRFLWPIALAPWLAASAAEPASKLLPLPVPLAPPGFTVELAAREPLIRNPCAMAFDHRGRLFVGQGPQYRNPKPDTPGDTVVMLIDSDGDGIYDRAKTFARGLNCIQGLAWHGRDLYIANSPDLTIVRDLDGDDEADEYVLLYTDLGNIEHAIHGLNFGPDGKLYMSKGNSKGLNQPGRVAPKPFRELFGLPDVPGAPDIPPPRTFTKENYRATYQDPKDDWGRMGGILRANPDGSALEIVSRGYRNPWDIAFDDAFNWLGTDNDQSDGDRIFMPFFGADFGWAHQWSPHWTGENHLPTMPISGPVFTGSGTGIVFSDSPALPAAMRGVWFINDFLHRTTYVYRPRWEGALMQPAGGKWEPFLRAGDALFNPVDIEHAPDGSLLITSWGKSLGAEFRDGQQTNEGRLFRVRATASSLPPFRPSALPRSDWDF
ncbi:MAG: hypothetical protein RLZZ15_464, partial [Verrucomicrobiota bacterium]